MLADITKTTSNLI